MNYYNYNGKLYEKDVPVLGPDNRSFRYGDGLFETLKYKDGNVILSNEHFARLWHGMKLMQFEIPGHFTRELLKEQIEQLIQKNKIEEARIRLAVFRGDGGIYDPVNHLPNYIIQCWPLVNPTNTLNDKGLLAGIFEDAKKPLDRYSNVKHNSYLPYYMAALFAKKNKLNDAIVLNQEERICDTTIANIFVVSKETIITPALSEGCIAGIMRKAIIETLAQKNIQVLEQPVSQVQLMEADEIFLSNSILNIKWIGKIDDKIFGSSRIKEITSLLSATNPQVFC